MYNLGLMYKTGDGAAQDAKQAFKLFEAAAKRHHPESMYQVAKAYEAGEGTAVDLEQAKIWYDRASATGHEKAGYQSQRLNTQTVYPSQVNALFVSGGGGRPGASTVSALSGLSKK
jgi:TPR repeat protein